MDYKALLEQAQYKLQAKLADFLRLGNVLYDVKARLKPYLSTGNAQTDANAKALDAQADGYLANFRDYQAQGTALIGQATALKAKLDAALVSVDGTPANTSILGSAFSFVTSNLGETAKLAGDLGALTVRMDSLTTKVNDLSEAVDGMEDFAAGRGLSAKLAGVLSGAGETAKNTVYIVAGIAALVFLGPYFFSGLARQKWRK
jgi:hypothetical protein